MKFVVAASAAASLASLASAHGGVGTYALDGTLYQGWQPYNSASGQKTIQRQYSSFDPLLTSNLGSVNIRCNNAGTTGTGFSGSVKAGSTIRATWTQWTHRPATVLVYLAKCPSAGCNSWDGSGKVWFKIDNAGLISGTQNKGIWAGDQITDKLYWDTTIPATLAPGEYLIRHELIAVHQANNPQFYPECAQLTITGSGTASASGDFLVAFPGAYSASDPGINFNIDSQNAMTSTCYDIPGPAVWPSGKKTSCSGSSNPAPAPTTTAGGSTPTTLVPQPSPTSGCAAVTKYGQCGGSGYSGCTSCASGSTCSKVNDYYSQCL